MKFVSKGLYPFAGYAFDTDVPVILVDNHFYIVECSDESFSIVEQNGKKFVELKYNDMLAPINKKYVNKQSASERRAKDLTKITQGAYMIAGSDVFNELPVIVASQDFYVLDCGYDMYDISFVMLENEVELYFAELKQDLVIPKIDKKYINFSDGYKHYMQNKKL